MALFNKQREGTLMLAELEVTVVGGAMLTGSGKTVACFYAGGWWQRKLAVVAGG